jgi:ribosomal protein S18 acetylase RimI-like enzyme
MSSLYNGSADFFICHAKQEKLYSDASEDLDSHKAISLPFSKVEVARMEHLHAAKRLADKHKRELGFINQAILCKAIEANSLLVVPLLIDIAKLEQVAVGTEAALAGFVHFYVRRDSVVTLYSIVVAETYRHVGIGRRLFEELVSVAHAHGKTEIRLKCPAELAANAFYERLGLRVSCAETGKRRPLNVWTYTLGEK